MTINTDSYSHLKTAVLSGRKDFFQSLAESSPLKNTSFKQGINSDLYCSGIDYATCNGLIDHESGYIASDEEIKKYTNYFQKNHQPFIWWSDNSLLQAANFQYGGLLKGIALDLKNKPLVPVKTANTMVVKQVKTKEDIEIFTQILMEGFGMADHLKQSWIDVNTAVENSQKQKHFIAYDNDKPAGITTLCIGDQKVAGIWNLATLSDHRKKGIGTALITSALLEAKKLGCKEAMAILMPKGMAWNIFLQAGFSDVISFPFYIFGADSKELE